VAIEPVGDVVYMIGKRIQIDISYLEAGVRIRGLVTTNMPRKRMVTRGHAFELNSTENLLVMDVVEMQG